MIRIFIVILIGFVTGIVTKFDTSFTGDLIQIGLYVMMFFIGLDMSDSESLLRIFRRLGLKAGMLPILIICGSVVGGVITGLLFGYSWNEGAAIGSGMGWYSLSGVIIEPYSQELSAIAFMSNIFREVIAIGLVPFVALHIGHSESIAVPAAGAMDTVLPIIARSTDQNSTILGFFSGTILSLSIPFLVSFFINL